MSYLIAVGTASGENVDLKFGEVREFYIYRVDGKDVKLEETREAERNAVNTSANTDVVAEGTPTCSQGSCGSAQISSRCSGNSQGCGSAQASGCGGNGQGCSGPGEVLGRVELIADCRCVVCKKIGFQAQKQFEKKAISVFDVECSVSEALEKITSYYCKIDNRQSLRKTEG